MAKYQWESDYYFRLGFWWATPTADEIKAAYRTKRRTSPPRAPTWQELAAQAVEAALRRWLVSKL